MLKFFLALLIAFFCWPAQALVLNAQMGLRESASLSGHLATLRDVGGLLRIEDVTVPDNEAKFSALPDFLGAGYTNDTYWLRFTLQRTTQAPHQWLLEVAPPYLNDVTLFVPHDNGGFDAMRLGDLQPFAERPVPYRSFVFPVRLADDRPMTLYLRVKTTSTMLVRVQAWQHNGLLASAQTNTSMYSVYFGILALGVMSNFVLWLWLRERIYLSYCGYLLALIVVMMATAGFLAQWVFPHSPLLANRLVGVTVGLVYLLGTYFFADVLLLRDHFPWCGRVLDSVMLFYLFCIVAAATGYYGLVAPWMLLTVFIVNFGMALAGPVLVWNGKREYLLYSVAFAANFAAIPLITVKLMGWISFSMSTDDIVVVGSIIHIVLVNFAVADRVRRAEKKMLLAVKQVAELASERDAAQQQRQFVAMVSHEFRTPLAVIDATAQSIDMMCSQSATVSHEFIAPRQEKIRRAVRRMVSLLDNFLTHERLDFNGPQIEDETLDLRELVNEAVKSWTHLVQTPDQFRLELGEKVVMVRAQQAMMRLALSNLIDNAIKYAPRGSPMTLRVGNNQNEGWIEVEDIGIGIAAKEMGQIFDKFFRGSDAQTTPGAGLGLYLVRTIVRRQGGEVDIESTLGKGSLFRVRLALVA